MKINPTSHKKWLCLLSLFLFVPNAYCQDHRPENSYLELFVALLPTIVILSPLFIVGFAVVYSRHLAKKRRFAYAYVTPVAPVAPVVPITPVTPVADVVPAAVDTTEYYKMPSPFSLTNHFEMTSLSRLEKFESEKKFLRSEASAVNLANILNTSQRYTFKLILIHRGKNISDYITDLRINYIVERLRSEPKYRQFSQQAISEEAGFGSVSTYRRAFKNKMGLSHFEFIEEIEASNSD